MGMFTSSFSTRHELCHQNFKGDERFFLKTQDGPSLKKKKLTRN